MVKELLGEHLCVVGAGVFELAHPRVLNLGEDESAGFAFGDVVEALVVERGLPHGFHLGADDVVGGFVETVVVGRFLCEPLETKAVVPLVVGIVGDEANEVLFPLLLVVRDVQEDGEQAFSEFVEVGVSRLTDDCREALRRFREEGCNAISLRRDDVGGGA